MESTAGYTLSSDWMLKDGYEATRIAIEAMEVAEMAYMLVGGLSSNAYGIPRSTKDADIVLAVDSAKLKELADALGPDFELDPHASFEMVSGTIRYHLRVPSITFEIELFLLSDDAHDRSRFERRRKVRSDQLGIEATIPAPEDVIVMKPRWAKTAGRLKDMEDIRDVIAVQGDEALDWDYIHKWAAEHETRELLDEIRASIPPID